MKAQFWSFDVIFAMIVFSSALFLLSYVWLGVSNQYATSYGMGTQVMQAQLQGLQLRILAQGTPANWNSAINLTSLSTWANVSVGLGTGNVNQLSNSKLMTLMAMANYNATTYQASKALLGVGYEYYILINSTSTRISLGLSPYSYNPYAIVVASQSAVLNGIPVKMQISLWTNKSFGVV